MLQPVVLRIQSFNIKAFQCIGLQRHGCPQQGHSFVCPVFGKYMNRIYMNNFYAINNVGQLSWLSLLTKVIHNGIINLTEIKTYTLQI